MDQPGGSGSKWLKVWNKDQTIKKAILAGCYNELVEKTKTKFNVGMDIKFVLMEDGTEVDEEYFEVLLNNTILMLLKTGEVWEKECQEEVRKEDDVPKSEVLGLLEKLRKRKGTLTKGKSAKGKLLRIQLGWMDFSYNEKRYKQVKNTAKNPDISNRSILLSGNTNYDETLEKVVAEFFPRGKNARGKQSSFSFELGNSKGQLLNREKFSVGNWVENISTQKPRLYLLSKKKVMNFTIESAESCESDFELLDVADLFTDIQPQPVSTNVGSSIVQSSVSLGHTPSSGILAQANISTPTTVTFVQTDTPTISFRRTAERSLNSTTCGICLDRPKSAFLLCGHTFCMVCATQMEANKLVCPICRDPILKVNPLFQ